MLIQKSFPSFESRIADRVSANIAHNKRVTAKSAMYGSVPSRSDLLTEDAEKVERQMLDRMTQANRYISPAQVKRAAAKQRNRSNRTSRKHLYR